MGDFLHTEHMFLIGGGMVILGLATAVFFLFSGSTTAVNRHGLRGYQRQRARRSSAFATFEPLLRIFASWFSFFPVTDMRAAIDKDLAKAGQYLGLTPDELMAMSLLAGAGGGLAMSFMFESPLFVAIGCALTVFLPYAMVSGAASRRAIQVSRELASVIELVALCVSAGMDLPGAMREVIGDDPEVDDPLRQELRQLLRELDLGHSRKQAMQALSDRVDGEGMRDFCASVIQSEERGNPLKEVLDAQAKVLRMRRSFRAEVLASKAAVKLVIPLTMLMMVVLLLVGGPLIVRFQQGGL